MKHLFLCGIILLSVTFAKAQKIHLTFFGGISNYQGDLQPKKYTFQQANFAVGFGALYEITQKLYIRGNITFASVTGDDKFNGIYLNRNLSFSSPITDVHLGLEYDLLNSYEKSLAPFIFAGISGFHFNPSTIDTLGAKAYLQPLGTEGQGFFMGRTKYHLTQLSIPFGGGIKLSLTDNVRVRLEIGFRKTFTDYLDDVSSTYADPVLLLQNNGQQAVDLAFRGDELKGSATVYPNTNSRRGNPKSGDWYYFTGIGVSFRLSPMFDTGNGPGKKKSGCPINF
ncbi:MAG: DUF6089 family protein [Ferruginibacter sp.]